jgi:E3 ubiquitin-protein ligase ATL6/9/15/31/42/55
MLNGIMGALLHKKFDINEFKEVKECSICLTEFGEDDEVTPLPCSRMHYFHTQCIEMAIKANPQCPLCRHPITLEEL